MKDLKETLLPKILEAAKVHPSRVKGCYVFGSRVYGTASHGSDWDIVLIANAPSYEVEVKSGDLNIHIVTPDVALKYAKDNHIKAIECLCAPEWAKIIDFDFNFVYNEKSFRHNISHTVSNSWVKAKKKLAQGDYYIGLKSLFHSLRIVDFGTQFASNRSIDFSSSNDLWYQMNERQYNWQELSLMYKELINKRLTEFRKLVSK
jgi:hypothetical protein